MDLSDYTRFIFAFAFVIGLIWAVAKAARTLGLDKKLRGITGAQGRLQLLDVLFLDPKRKVVLLRADARDYVLLLSGETALVIDTLPDTTASRGQASEQNHQDGSMS